MQALSKYRVTVNVKDIRGSCPLYRVGDRIVVEQFFIQTKDSVNVCIHAFSSFLTLLSAFAHGSSAKELGIGLEDDIGCIRCPDPGPPLTPGGTVTFELVREPSKKL